MTLNVFGDLLENLVKRRVLDLDVSRNRADRSEEAPRAPVEGHNPAPLKRPENVYFTRFSYVFARFYTP